MKDMETLAQYEMQLKMSKEENRKASFKKWIFKESHSCSATKLAEAGFYFIGNENEPDSVQCFHCLKSLDGWEPEDDPWKEHLKHASYCTFAKLGLPEKNITLLKAVDMYRELAINSIKKLFEEETNEDDEYTKLGMDILARMHFK